MATDYGKRLNNVDSFARNINNQIVKATKLLGSESTITKNLVNFAEMHFKTRLNKNGVVQISRGKKDLETYSKSGAYRKARSNYYVHNKGWTDKTYLKKDGTPYQHVNTIRGVFNIQNELYKIDKRIIAKGLTVNKENRLAESAINIVTEDVGTLYKEFSEDNSAGFAMLGINTEKIQEEFETFFERIRKGEVSEEESKDFYQKTKSKMYANGIPPKGQSAYADLLKGFFGK